MKLKIFQPQRARVEMMPLIDSFFLILVYFIYVFISMSTHKGIALNLPNASTAVSDKADHVVISIDKNGRVYIDKQLTAQDALKGYLEKHYIQERESLSLYVSGDTDAPYGAVIYVLNTARELGIEKVLVETNVQNDKNQ